MGKRGGIDFSGIRPTVRAWAVSISSLSFFFLADGAIVQRPEFRSRGNERDRGARCDPRGAVPSGRGGCLGGAASIERRQRPARRPDAVSGGSFAGGSRSPKPDRPGSARSDRQGQCGAPAGRPRPLPAARRLRGPHIGAGSTHEGIARPSVRWAWNSSPCLWRGHIAADSSSPTSAATVPSSASIHSQTPIALSDWPATTVGSSIRLL